MCKCSKKLGGGEDHTHTHRAGGEARRGKTLEPEPQATRQTTMGGNNVEARYFADRACSASLHLWGSQSRRCYRYAHFTDEEMEALGGLWRVRVTQTAGGQAEPQTLSPETLPGSVPQVMTALLDVLEL